MSTNPSEVKELATATVTPLVATEMPKGVSPLVALLASGQLQAENIERAMELQERHESYEAKKAFSTALSKFRKVAPTLKKDKTVDFKTQKGRTYYSHTSLGYALSEVNPLLGECDLNISWHPRQENGVVIVETRLTHTLGHSESVELQSAPDNSGNKNPIQAVSSAITYLQRAGAMSLLGLASGEDDDGIASAPAPRVEVISEDQSMQILSLLDLIDELSAGYKDKWKAYNANKFDASEYGCGLALPLETFEGSKASLAGKLKTLQEGAK